MKAWLLHSLGGLERLSLGEASDPRPAPGEVVLRLKYAGLNPADRYLAEGQYPARPTFPHILGRDGIGFVESIGEGVSEFHVGEKAAVVRSELGVSRNGTFAERVAVSVESLMRPPAGWSDEESGCATLVYLTAYQAITQWGDLPEKSVVLVSGASGGVGVAALQLGKAMGHTVIGLSRSSEKSATLGAMGADAIFDPNDTQWRRSLRDVLKGRRIDLAIDNIGGSLFSELIDSLAENGRVSCVGRLAGPVPQFNSATLFFRRIQIRGVAVGAYTAHESQRHWELIVALLSKTGARPVVDRVFPFDQLIEAFAHLQAGPMGKVLLQIPIAAK